MKKLLYLFLVLLLVSCGSEKAANISTDTSKVTISTASSVKITAQSIISEMGKGKYKEGELLVKFKSGVIGTSSLKLHQAVGASVIKRFNVVPNLERIKIPESMSIEEAILQYMSDPNVEYAEPNYIRCASSIPPPIDTYFNNQDTYFNNQWALNNTGEYANGTKGADINALGAWGYTKGSSDIIVAVLDSGIDYNHQDLVGNIWINTREGIGDANGDGCPGICGVDDDGDGKVDEDSLGRQHGEAGYTNDLKDDDDENGYIDDYKGWNFVGDNNDPMDDYGHGTHVAGIIGAKGNNHLGIAGVMWNVQLMPLKIYNADTTLTRSCTSVYASDEVEAIYYAVNNGAKVINASINGEGNCISEYNAINYANSKGVLFIAAAGNGDFSGDGVGDNNDLTPHYPSGYDLQNIISVAATDQNDRRASFSNYGPTSVDVAAPGVYVISTLPNWMTMYPGYGILDLWSGTSMAAPHVSGLAGLLFSYYDGYQNRKLNHSQIRDTILKCVDIEKDGYPGLQTLKGWIYTNGRINAYKAVASLAVPTDLTLSATSPNQVSLSWSANATCEAWHKVERKTGEGNWEVLGNTLPNSLSYIDTTVAPGTTYTYRVTAVNNIAESFPSKEKEIPTPLTKNTGGGGGCSIGMRPNTPTAIADTATLLIPLLFIAILRRRR